MCSLRPSLWPRGADIRSLPLAWHVLSCIAFRVEKVSLNRFLHNSNIVCVAVPCAKNQRQHKVVSKMLHTFFSKRAANDSYSERRGRKRNLLYSISNCHYLNVLLSYHSFINVPSFFSFSIN